MMPRVLLLTIFAIAFSKVECKDWMFSTFYQNIFNKNIDIQEILKNEKMVQTYLNCLMDNGAYCPSMAARLKEHLTEIMANNCADCTENQKELKEIIVHYLQENKPDTFKALTRKFKLNSRSDNKAI